MVESGKTNVDSFSHAFGMTAPSRREPDCQQSLSKKQILHKKRGRTPRDLSLKRKIVNRMIENFSYIIKNFTPF